MTAARLIVLFTAVIGAAARPVSAQTPDVVYVTGEADTSPAMSGVGVDGLWVHPLTLSSAVNLGASSFSLAGTSWSYGTLGAYSRRRQLVYAGQASFGSGTSPSATFAYFRAIGSASHPVARGTQAELEAQYIRALGSGTVVIKAGAVFSRVRKTILHVSYYNSLAPGSHAQYLSGQGELTLERFSVLGGLTANLRTATSGVDLVDLVTHTAPDYFVGASIPVRGARMMFVTQVLPQPAGHLKRFTTTMKVPLLQHREGP